LWGSTIAARGLAANCLSGGEKNCIVYILFCIFIIILLLQLVVLALLFPLLSYQTVFITTHKFLILSISGPQPTGWGKGLMSEQLSSAWLLAAGLNYNIMSGCQAYFLDIINSFIVNFARRVKPGIVIRYICTAYSRLKKLTDNTYTENPVLL